MGLGRGSREPLTVGDVQLVADGQAPDSASHAGRDPLPPQVPNFPRAPPGRRRKRALASLLPGKPPPPARLPANTAADRRSGARPKVAAPAPGGSQPVAPETSSMAACSYRSTPATATPRTLRGQGHRKQGARMPVCAGVSATTVTGADGGWEGPSGQEAQCAQEPSCHGTAPAGAPLQSCRRGWTPGGPREQPVHPPTHRQHTRARGPTPTAGGPHRAVQGAEARGSQGHTASRRDEAPNARQGSPRSTLRGHGRPGLQAGSHPSPRLPVHRVLRTSTRVTGAHVGKSIPCVQPKEDTAEKSGLQAQLVSPVGSSAGPPTPSKERT